MKKIENIQKTSFLKKIFTFLLTLILKLNFKEKNFLTYLYKKNNCKMPANETPYDR